MSKPVPLSFLTDQEVITDPEKPGYWDYSNQVLLGHGGIAGGMGNERITSKDVIYTGNRSQKKVPSNRKPQVVKEADVIEEQGGSFFKGILSLLLIGGIFWYVIK